MQKNMDYALHVLQINSITRHLYQVDITYNPDNHCQFDSGGKTHSMQPSCESVATFRVQLG